jgi:ribosomal silencing factor RsfS
MYLETQGAENAVTITVNGDFDEFKHLVIASGRSVRHIRKMTESVVSAVSYLLYVPVGLCAELVCIVGTTDEGA